MKRYDGTEIHPAEWNNRRDGRCTKCKRLGPRELLEPGPAAMVAGKIEYPLQCKGACKPVDDRYITTAKPPHEARLAPGYFDKPESRAPRRGLSAYTVQVDRRTVKAKVAEIKKDIARMEASLKSTRAYMKLQREKEKQEDKDAKTTRRKVGRRRGV